MVEADNRVSLDFAETSYQIASQHHAFLVGEEEFNATFGRIREQTCPTGQIPARPSAEPLTTVTAAAACTSKTRRSPLERQQPPYVDESAPWHVARSDE